jgi:transaldolase
MKLFIDSADIDEIKQFYAWGIADGITTNPSLMKKAVEIRKKRGEKINIKKYIESILKVAGKTPVSLEVTETTQEGMISQGKALYKLFQAIGRNVVIKIPINSAFKPGEPQFAGIAAIRELKKSSISVNCTLVFTPEQALLAAKAGATYVSPFAGRVDDCIRKSNRIKFEKNDYFPHNGMWNGKMLSDNGVTSGVHLVEQCVVLLQRYKMQTKVLAASLRNARQVREVALVGADIATLPFSLAEEMIVHQKTVEGMVNFTKDIVPEYTALTQQKKKVASAPRKSEGLGISIQWAGKK